MCVSVCVCVLVCVARLRPTTGQRWFDKSIRNGDGGGGAFRLSRLPSSAPAGVLLFSFFFFFFFFSFGYTDVETADEPVLIRS